MALHDDRTFMRHFSWVLIGLVSMAIFFIFLAFLIVGITGVDSHSGYSYVSYVKQHPGAAPAHTAPKATAAAAAGTTVASAATASAGASAQQAAAASAPGGGTASAVAAAATAGAKAAAGQQLDGHKIWQAHCAMCHQTGVANAPKIGDKSEWAPILSGASLKTIFGRDIHGYTGKRGTMPAKGGNPSLSDAQVIAAAKYMIGKSGGHPGS